MLHSVVFYDVTKSKFIRAKNCKLVQSILFFLQSIPNNQYADHKKIGHSKTLSVPFCHTGQKFLQSNFELVLFSGSDQILLCKHNEMWLEAEYGTVSKFNKRIFEQLKKVI